jgi:hypothetical protein
LSGREEPREDREIDTLDGCPSLTFEAKRLYVGTGFPQAGQGKPGENYGESNVRVNMFIFYDLRRLRLAQWVLGVW